MGKGDIGKSDANGSRKQDTTKTGKDDVIPEPNADNVTKKNTYVPARKKVAATGKSQLRPSNTAISTTLSQFAKTMKDLSEEVKSMKKVQKEQENDDSETKQIDPRLQKLQQLYDKE